MPPLAVARQPVQAQPFAFSALPLGTAGFDDTLDYLCVAKAAPVVKSLAFLDWKPVPPANPPAAVAEVAAPRSLITAATSLGARVAAAAADFLAWRNAEPMES